MLRKHDKTVGHLVAQLVECPTSVQVTISFVSSSSKSGSVLTAQSLEPASGSALSLSLSLPLFFS